MVRKAAVSLLESGNTVKTPDVATALAWWKLLLIRLAIVTNLLHTPCIGGAVASPIIGVEIRRLVFDIERGLRYDLPVHHPHPVLV